MCELLSERNICKNFILVKLHAYTGKRTYANTVKNDNGKVRILS